MLEGRTPIANACKPNLKWLRNRLACRRLRRQGLTLLAAFATASFLVVQKAVASAPAGSTFSSRLMSYSGIFGSVVLDSSLGFLCFFIYAVTAGAETAITTLWPWKVRELAQRESEAGKLGMWSALRTDLNRFLQTILIAATICSVLGVALVTKVSEALFGPNGLIAATIMLTIWQLVMCEIVPKSVAVVNALGFCRKVLPVVYSVSTIIYPVAKYIDRFVELLLGLFGISADASKAPLVSEDELDLIFTSAVKSGVVDSEEGEMIFNVRNLDSKRVKEVMTPLVDMTCIATTATVSELQSLWLSTKLSRIPVYSQGRVDCIDGIVSKNALLEHFCNAAAVSKDDQITVGQKTVGQICSKAVFVPETMSLQKALQLLKDCEIAICVDERGSTAGLVTLEDVIEEIVGEVYDPGKEKDVLERKMIDSLIQKVDSGRYTMNAAVEIEDVAEVLLLNIPKGDYNTAGGFVVDALDRLPVVGEAVVLLTTRGEVRFEVTRVDDRKVLQIDVREDLTESTLDKTSAESSNADEEAEQARVIDLRLETIELPDVD